MNRAEPVYELTMQMKQLLNQEITGKTRESIIEQLTALITQRGIAMKALNPPYTEAEKQLGKELMQVNEEIQSKMQMLFLDLKKEMKQVKMQKKSNQSYTNPYKNVQTMDGMFMDSKK
ncbi:flagellar protein FliT [Oceanobacillus profundus]|uniref:Flagellar protein FliT n=2 Tax=Oceanobacillus profundus TaxID=372463 RepID=A0A417YEY7_9BACI|nr:flagellar protein FliT [Oceanobacillus profundus]MBR3117983.1 flagellar protein FliT [Oceanobacillus sp.]PAE28585.1 flagellar protein FliT [Paenibacillus sp. 7884-2]MCM3397293.1 flagellar protein FliT [Oceanobacillus profundus]MDO6449538.1 flagellar protein FliT [Oceanobacillus profundus]RHW31221.1 flagellar protein FliT [Oceanobacillus profundus]